MWRPGGVLAQAIPATLECVLGLFWSGQRRSSFVARNRIKSPAKFELLGDGLITDQVLVVQVIEQTAALANHDQEAAA